MATETVEQQSPLELIDRASAKAGPLGAAVLKSLSALASLKFTVALFGMSIFIVLAGTMAQVDKDIWQVIDEYFRVPIWPTLGFAWIDLQIFFPPSFFPGKPQVPGGFWFPGGWMIGGLMAVNLLAAHGLRFKIQASGTRLLSGLGVIAFGMLVTWLVIASGSNKTGVQEAIWVDWQTLWVLMKIGLGAAFLSSMYGYLVLTKSGTAERWLLAVAAVVPVILGGLFFYILWGGRGVQLGDSSMRILWQLIKGTFAGLVLLAGCVLVFKKRAGIVLLHSGIGLMMLSELLVGLLAVETQMTIDEGETANFVQDIRTVELAVVDPSNPDSDDVVVVPKRYLTGQKSQVIKHAELPFDIEVVRFMENSVIRNVKPDDQNPADTGAGLSSLVEEAKPGSGTDSSGQVDIASAYLKLIDKQDGKPLGTFLMSLYLKPQPVTAAGKTYEVALRFKRTYKPYSVHLIDVRKDDYLGTDTPRNYSSDIQLEDEGRNVNRKIKIWMNNPLRFAGETFYQSSYGRNPQTGVETTTLSVVTNTGWVIPYVSCMIVATGLLAHFSLILLRFLRRRATDQNLEVVEQLPGNIVATTARQTDRKTKKTGKTATTHNNEVFEIPDGSGPVKTEGGIAVWLVPALIVLLFAGWVGSKARTPKAQSGQIDFYEFGKLPVVYQGRIKPYDTLARNSLRIISEAQTFVDKNGDRQPAIRWLLDVMSGAESAGEHQVFRITNPDVVATLKLMRRSRYRYSFKEIEPQLDELMKQAQLAEEIDAEQLSVFQRKVLSLNEKLHLYNKLRVSHLMPPSATAGTFEKISHILRMAGIESELARAHVPLSVPTSSEENPWEPLAPMATRIWIHEAAERAGVATLGELSQALVEDVRKTGEIDNLVRVDLIQTVVQAMGEQKGLTPVEARRIALERLDEMPAQVRRDLEDRIRQRTETSLKQRLTLALMQIMGTAGLDDESNPAARSLLNILIAYRAGEVESFHRQLTEHQPVVASIAPQEIDVTKTNFEAFFNHFESFYYSSVLYVVAFVLTALSWLLTPLGFARLPNRSAFWLIGFTLLMHTFALVSRMYISGRPPVTNLYSSAVFIGWGAVVFGLVLEMIFRKGIGNVIGSMSGFATLLIAHMLAGDGDTFTVLQAVLDTQFWLATHVVCITLGYTATFVAGLLGIVYVLAGVTTPALSQKLGRDLARMVYGTLCFAIFFSFVGTVLGGLWADDSWGRFWGWDPKENGALMIVLWNALVLHARWGGMVRERGLAVLAIGGNIVTSWSWFGVNELGVGLHSYGFTDGVLLALGLFVASQLVVIAVGCLPKEVLWSYRARSR